MGYSTSARADRWRRVLAAIALCVTLGHGAPLLAVAPIPCGMIEPPDCEPGNSTCPPGHRCDVDGNACTCQEISCCLINNGMDCAVATQLDCEPNGMFVPNGDCQQNACVTNTPNPTPTLTPTNTRVPDGGSCMTSAECASLSCVDGVCQPLVSPAPATSGYALAAGLVILIGLGAVAMRRIGGAAR
jgi:hypothetical protein